MRYVLIAVLLAGCATPEQRAERLIARYGPVCDKMGYAKDSDAWRNCVMGQANAATSRPAPAVRAPLTCTTIGNQTQCH